jgi:two-component system chemotaxis sensor kinase CheA
MIDALRAGEQPVPCGKELLDRLHGIGASGSDSGHTPAHSPASEVSTPAGNTSTPVAVAEVQEVGTPLSLPSQKEAILELMVTDLRESAAHIDQLAAQALSGGQQPGSVGRELEDLCEALGRTLEFFEIPDMYRLVKAAGVASAALQERPAFAAETLVRVRGVVCLLKELADGLDSRRVRAWETGLLEQRLAHLASGQELTESDAVSHGGDPRAVLSCDGVVAISHAVGVSSASQASARPAASAESAGGAPQPAGGETSSSDAVAGAAKSSEVTDGAKQDRGGEKASGDQTIRVEVSRLETLLSLVGQLVLAKNRISALGRKLRNTDASTSIVTDMLAASGELDRLTGELQMGVMRTRMQPLAKLFDRYPRVIRDIARATGKDIDLEIAGKDTEVDKSVLELLADPLVHMIRNSADHGIETAEKRVALGKPARGTIKVSASHQGSHVRVELYDDGKGIDPAVIGRKAIERGLATADEVAAMSRDQIIQFIFSPGLSTAEKVTDLSGRGVGMDVVRTNVNKMGGGISVQSEVGRSTRVEILIPLTVAIMPAMVVGVGQGHFCIPLQTITEIVRNGDSFTQSVGGQPVLRLRDEVLPLIELRKTLHETAPATDTDGRFAVIVYTGSSKAGLVVDRLIGQQEIVIRPLDDEYTQGGPFSGATIRDEGDVSLILDVNQLMGRLQARDRAAA